MISLRKRLLYSSISSSTRLHILYSISPSCSTISFTSYPLQSSSISSTSSSSSSTSSTTTPTTSPSSSSPSSSHSSTPPMTPSSFLQLNPSLSLPIPIQDISSFNILKLIQLTDFQLTLEIKQLFLNKLINDKINSSLIIDIILDNIRTSPPSTTSYDILQFYYKIFEKYLIFHTKKSINSSNNVFITPYHLAHMLYFLSKFESYPTTSTSHRNQYFTFLLNFLKVYSNYLNYSSTTTTTSSLNFDGKTLSLLISSLKYLPISSNSSASSLKIHHLVTSNLIPSLIKYVDITHPTHQQQQSSSSPTPTSMTSATTPSTSTGLTGNMMMTPTEFLNAMTGIRHLNSNHDSIQQLLAALTTRFTLEIPSPSPLSSLYSTTGSSSRGGGSVNDPPTPTPTPPPTTTTTPSLTMKRNFKKNSYQWNSLEITELIYNFHHITYHGYGVKKFIEKILIPLLKSTLSSSSTTCTEFSLPFVIVRCLQGIANMSIKNCEITKEFITLLAKKFSSSLTFNTLPIYDSTSYPLPPHTTTPTSSGSSTGLNATDPSSLTTSSPPPPLSPLTPLTTTITPSTTNPRLLSNHFSHLPLSFPSSFSSFTSSSSFTPLQGQDIAEIFFAFRNFSSNEKEIILLYDSLLPYINKSSTIQFNQNQFCITLSGLRNTSSNNYIIDHILHSILMKSSNILLSNDINISFERFIHALYGIHHMNFSNPLILQLMGYLNHLLNLFLQQSSTSSSSSSFIILTNRSFHRLFVSLRYISLYNNKHTNTSTHTISTSGGGDTSATSPNIIPIFLLNLSKLLLNHIRISTHSPITFRSIYKSLIGFENMTPSSPATHQLLRSYIHLIQQNHNLLEKLSLNTIITTTFLNELTSNEYVEFSEIFKRFSLEDKVIGELLETFITPMRMITDSLNSKSLYPMIISPSIPIHMLSSTSNPIREGESRVGGDDHGIDVVGKNRELPTQELYPKTLIKLKSMTLHQLGMITKNFKNLTYGSSNFIQYVHQRQHQHHYRHHQLQHDDDDDHNEINYNSLLISRYLQSLIDHTNPSSIMVKEYLKTTSGRSTNTTATSDDTMNYERINDHILSLEDFAKAIYGLRLMHGAVSFPSTGTRSTSGGPGIGIGPTGSTTTPTHRNNKNETIILIERLCDSYLLSKALAATAPATGQGGGPGPGTPPGMGTITTPPPSNSLSSVLTYQQFHHKVYTDEFYHKYNLYSFSKILLAYSHIPTQQILQTPSIRQVLHDIFLQIHQEVTNCGIALNHMSSSSPSSPSPSHSSSTSSSPTTSSSPLTPPTTSTSTPPILFNPDDPHLPYILKYLLYLYQSLLLFCCNPTLQSSLLKQKDGELFHLIHQTLHLFPQYQIPSHLASYSSLIFPEPSLALLSYIQPLHTLKLHFLSKRHTITSMTSPPPSPPLPTSSLTNTTASTLPTITTTTPLPTTTPTMTTTTTHLPSTASTYYSPHSHSHSHHPAHHHTPTPTKRCIECFHNLLFHGYECDILLVSYYPNWMTEDEIQEIKNEEKMKKRMRRNEGEEEDEEDEDEDEEENMFKSLSSIKSGRYYSPIPSSIFFQSIPNSTTSTTTTLNTSPHPFSSTSTPSSSTTPLSTPSTTTITSSHSSYNSFEDFLSQCRHKDQLYIMNIEVDGPHRQNNISTLHRIYSRDQYLGNMHHVAVKRIQLSENHKDSPMNMLYDEFQNLVSHP